MSLSWAEFISFWSNWTLLAALLVGVIATYGIVVSGDVKEASAKKEIAALRVRAADAELELAKIKKPRKLSLETTVSLANAIKPFAGKKFDLSVIPGDPEAFALGIQIAETLKDAKWEWIEWSHPTGPLTFVYNLPGKPNIGQLGLVGINIQLHEDHFTEFNEAGVALSNALNEAGIPSVREVANDALPNHDTLHIIVGKKQI